MYVKKKKRRGKNENVLIPFEYIQGFLLEWYKELLLFLSTNRLKEQGVATMGDDVDVYLLANDAHRTQLVGGDGADDDAVVIVVKRLHFG